MEVRLLGGLEAVSDGGRSLAVQGAKLRALLAMLALDAGRVVPTDRLVEGLWADDTPSDVANSLQRLVSKLRKALGAGDLVTMRPPGYVLGIEPAAVDVHRFDRLVADARRLVDAGDRDEALDRFREAEALWRGPALADFAYDEFAQPHIARLDEARLALVEDRVDAEQSLGRPSPVGDIEALVAEHPTRERLRGQLMLALYREGRQADALRVFQDGRTILAEELGLEPGPALRELEAAILRHDPTLGAAPPPTARPTAPAPADRTTRMRGRSVPQPTVTRLVGRDDELDALAGLLDRNRLVTLVGPGGAGKTRLAFETARRAAATSDGEVVVVELASVGDPAAVPAAIGSAFDLPNPEVDPIARIQERCDGRAVLLVLDNCEHLVDAAAAAADAILHGDATRVLATSREALRVPGEAVWVVPPLRSPEAVELFVDRATAADARFEVHDDDRAVIGDICARLDGLPLAIELAAARTRAFTVRQVAERLDDRFRLLSGGARTAMARQQTLRAVVDWSYDLLFEDERRVFERLAVFPGGCSVATAEAVCTGDGLDAYDVLECISGLVDKSLLTVDRSGPEARYGMLQTLSQYGRERLVERGEADAAFRRMAVAMAAVCEGARRAVRGIDQLEWFRAVDAEQPNIRTALEWALGAGDKDLAVAIAADIAFDRWVAGGVAEGHRVLERALALPGAIADPFLDGWARHWDAFLGFVAGRHDGFEARFAEAVELLLQHADPVFAAYAMSFETQLTDALGRRDRSVERNHELLAVLATTEDPWARPATRWVEAGLAVQERGDYDAFEAGLRDAAALYRDAGDRFMTAVCLDLTAELAETRGELDEATSRLDEALTIVRGWGLRSFEAALLARLARAAVARAAGDAAALAEESLARAGEVVFRPARAMSLNTIADLRRREGRLDEAEQAAGGALELYRGAPAFGFPGSYSRATTPFDVPVGASTSLSILGFVAEARGEAAGAIERHRAAYAEVVATVHPRAIPLALEGLAAAVLLDGDARWAAQLLGAADAVRSTFGTNRAPTEQADVDRVAAAATERLGPEAFAEAREQGTEVPADRLVAAPVGG